ncbi:hypothetical protein EWM64_g5649 [Hericium alpestre]|uniref:Uncharacterized protein n=1 Tax=Hericium alpestre TaxID=135208 RepID=A0A4Y9ZWD1_9AGAM|nr:hypothetical protein EWM64_g5649 [Hericium alpestre]
MPGINFATPQTPQTPNNSTFADPSFSFDFKPDVTELDARAAIQTKLNRRLGPEYVSQRPAPGGGPS